MIETLKKFWQSKTFGFLAIVFLIATALLLFDKLTGGMWIDLVQWLTGAGTVRGTTEVYKRKTEEKRSEIDKILDSTSDVELAQRAVDRTDRS